MAAIWWAWLCVVVQVHAQIRVMSPGWLVDQFSGEKRGRIEGSTATFGAPFYGDDVIGRLVWGESLHGHHHCQDDDYDVPPPSEFQGAEYSEVRLINIVIVRRGMCSFTTKVRIAAAKGAHAVIIVDQDDSSYTSADMQRIIVADDGFGSSIHIPSILVAKDEGKKLIDAANQTQVIVQLSWDVPTNHVVNMDLWMSSGSEESMRFLKEFSEKRKILNEVVQFTPHYHVFSMPASDPAVYAGLCSDTTGQFCAEDPDASGTVTGKDVLDEDVRQLCIHELTKVPRNNIHLKPDQTPPTEFAKGYWDYVEGLLTHCPMDQPHLPVEKRFSTECLSSHMSSVSGIDVAAVQACMSRDYTTKLKHERDNTAWSPRALRINGWRFSGILDPDLVTRAVCAGFIKKPQECEDLIEPRSPFEKYLGNQKKGVSVRVFVFGLGSVALLALTALCLYRRSLKAQIHTTLREEVMLEVQSQMAQYNRLPQ